MSIAIQSLFLFLLLLFSLPLSLEDAHEVMFGQEQFGTFFGGYEGGLGQRTLAAIEKEHQFVTLDFQKLDFEWRLRCVLSHG